MFFKKKVLTLTGLSMKSELLENFILLAVDHIPIQLFVLFGYNFMIENNENEKCKELYIDMMEFLYEEQKKWQ